MTYKKIGELCLEKRLINNEQLNEALKVHEETGLLLSAVFVKMGLLTKDQIYELLQEQNALLRQPASRQNTKDLLSEEAVLLFLAAEGYEKGEEGRLFRIGLMEVSGFKKAESLELAINTAEPPEAVSKYSLNENGTKYSVWEAMRKLRKFVGDRYVFTYNAPRDYSILKPIDSTGILRKKLVGLLTLWRRVHQGPGSGYISFENILEKTKYSDRNIYDHEGSLKALHHLYTEILTELKVKKNISDLQEVWNFFDRNLDEREDINRRIYDEIKNAVDNKKDVTITYLSPWTTEETNRKITPKKFITQAGKLHLVAFCHLREAERWFKLERITSAEPL